MVRLSYRQRQNLPASAFACPRIRKYPLVNKAHIRNALSRWNDASSAHCDGGAKRICNAARRAGIHAQGCPIHAGERKKIAQIVPAGVKNEWGYWIPSEEAGGDIVGKAALKAEKKRLRREGFTIRYVKRPSGTRTATGRKTKPIHVDIPSKYASRRSFRLVIRVR